MALSRKEQADPQLRAQGQSSSLVNAGTLTGSIRISGAVGLLEIVADLRAGTITVSVDVDAPKEGRATTRVNWLTRQLKDAPDGLRIEAWVLNARSSSSELLGVVRENPAVLIEDASKEFRTFRISAVSALGTKRGTGRGSFIDSVLSAADGFYGSVLQILRPWVPKAPQIPQGQLSAAASSGSDLSISPSDLDEDSESLDEPNGEELDSTGDDRKRSLNRRRSSSGMMPGRGSKRSGPPVTPLSTRMARALHPCICDSSEAATGLAACCGVDVSAQYRDPGAHLRNRTI